MHLSEQQLIEIQSLYDRGLCMQAWERAQAMCPLRQWRGTPARILAGRLAINLGAPRLARAMHFRALREDPAHPQAIYYYGFERAARGPLVAWEYLQKHGDLAEAQPELRADWLAMKCAVAASLRDFDTAEAALDAAQHLEPNRPWLWIERASLLEAEDRYEESLAAARKALELRPWYRPAVQATAHALQLLDRDDEALALLIEADRSIESGPVAAQLAALQCEMQRYRDARQSYARFEALSPLMEKEVSQWLLARRCDVAYYCGEKSVAIDLARQVKKSPFHEKIADRLAQSDGDGRRVLLDVAFVRQHHMTCAPATLSAISRFWSMPSDHLAVVEAICYDGTPAHSERNWAQQNGWLAREFTVTWDAVVALIDRGIPFTLTTIEPTNAHLQAVVGYDSFRGTLLVRDPYQYFVGEMLADAMLERYRASGPRGMALVPADRSHLLEDLSLPDAALYDLHHAVQTCLVRHDRAGAVSICEQIEALAPGHRLALSARRSLAVYDQDPKAGLECVERLLGLYENDGPLLLAKLSYLRSMTRREELLALLKEICAKKDTDPVFRQRWADELQADARMHPQAQSLLREAIRARPRDAWNFYVLANIYWDQRKWEKSLDLYRFSTCLEDKDETFARSYFAASRHFRQTETALRLLRSRYERFGRRSSQPARILFRALEELDQTVEAFALLQEAMQLRPDDGELLVFAAMVQARHGNFDQAEALLETVRGKARRAAWLSAAANLATYRGQLRQALELWKQVLDDEPLSMDAHQQAAQLLADTESRAAAIAHLRGAAERFPHHTPLQQLYISWLREEPPAVAEQALRTLLSNQPADAWARRELALNLAEQRRFDDAVAEAQQALALEPTNPVCHYVLGKVLAHGARLEEARDALRQAVRYSVDADFAISELINACQTAQQRREALAFVRDELSRQTIFGDGLLAYRAQAASELDPEELLRSLRQTLEDRPDLWHAWSAVVSQLTDMNRAQEAVTAARNATARFPLLPRLWVDQARACRAAADREGEIDALREALRISPGWGIAARELAGAFERGGDFEQARQILQAALVHAPMDPFNHGCLADILWKMGQRGEAIERLRQAVRLEPGYHWAWETLRTWEKAVAQPGLAAGLARELAQNRAGEARSWLVLAQLLDDPADGEERLKALDKAIELNPRLIDAHDQRAHCLARRGQFDEAAAACAAPAFGQLPPVELLARRAWVEHERGNLRDAIQRLRNVLTDSPNAYGAWRWLAEWLREAGDQRGYEEAVNTLVRLWPLDPFSLGYQADARLRAGDRPGAKESLRRAVQLAPDYIFGITTLFDLELEDGNFTQAEQTLATLRAQIGGSEASLRELQLACRRADEARATRQLEELSATGGEDDYALATAVGAMVGQGWHAAVDAVLKQSAVNPGGNPTAARLYLERLLATRGWRAAIRQLHALPSGEVTRRQALLGIIHGALPHPKPRKKLSRFIRTHAEELRRDTQLWGAVGYALLELQQRKQALKWMSDWRSRADVQPWMLQNLSIALRADGRDHEAADVVREAVLLPTDNTITTLRLWLAYDSALAGEIDLADELLAGIDPASIPPYEQYVRLAVAGHVRLARWEPSGARESVREIRRTIRAMRALPGTSNTAELRRLKRRLLHHLRRRTGWRTPWWVWVELYAVSLTVAIFLVLFATVRLLRLFST